ncbi:TetR/AcrR family transcriptional regulator [Nocardiopsis aegyptia]|uniref:AcrR family transcriptional regulator n=1 Tax=Nocardiopsis aegyptia TaxID=220378 RepID=A0A7Z0JB26_9ACTN|nr:TetR/AcrR family transcriptional regulator [Nocardiopsis aegyptia]NYJ35776.1 AcrR family transcriptional regulator [Nocardiopsis aegyptia]
MAAPAMNRRERIREATLVEIRSVAHGLLVRQGSAAVTINAVAREMGMSGPALYRYYSSHEELVGAVTADFYQELGEVMEKARHAYSEEDSSRRLLGMCRAMRSWVTAHPAEFDWMFASPIPGPDQPEARSPRLLAGLNFEQVFLDEVVRLWEKSPFGVPETEDLPDSLRDQMVRYSGMLDGRLPPGAAHVFLSCWIRLYGLLCMEVFRQLDFAYSDVTPIFENCLADLCSMLGLEYEPPAEPAPGTAPFREETES